MADNPKPPHNLPPLADKGAARPLAQTRPDESAAADAGDDRRPSGLHTRPDLFGSSAVMPRPAQNSAEDHDEAAPDQARESQAEGPGLDPQNEAPDTAAPEPGAATKPFERDPATRIGRPGHADETIGTPEDPGRSGSPVGVFLPVANLQDHPLRIPESIAFEDWPDGPDSEPDAGARSPEGASMGTTEPVMKEPEPEESDLAASEPGMPELSEPQLGMPEPGTPELNAPELNAPELNAPELSEPEPDDVAFPEKPAEATAPPDWQGPDWQAPDRQAPDRQARDWQALAFEDDDDRPKGLLAWLESEIDIRRFVDNRWLLPAGIASCAVLLVVGLAVGIIPIPGDDRETAQLAQDLDATAADDPASFASEVRQQDLPVAPAGSAMEDDSAAGTQPAGPGTAPGGRPGASQLAALPEAGAPETLDRDSEPIVDFMRIDPDGKAVVAGRAAPGTELTVLDNGEPLGTITADIYGLWTFVSEEPLSSGRHEIGLRVKRQGSDVSSSPVLVTDGGSPLAQEPEQTAGLEEFMTGAADEQDFAQTIPKDFQAPEQLAAAVPDTPVQSDASVPQSSAGQVESTADSAQAVKPEAVEPEAVEPEAVEPEAVEPEAVESEAVGPEAIEQAAAEQEAGEAEQAAAEPAAAATSTAPAPAPKPEPPDETQIAKAAPAGGDYVIQFASFLNPETAVREQALVEERFSDLLAGHEIFVQQIDIADQGTFYRVRLGPFVTLAEARATCARFQERDRDCLAMAR